TNLTGSKTGSFAADVANAVDVDRLFNETKAFGAIDIVINSAGVNIRGNTPELSEADWDSVVDVNLKGPFLMGQKFLPPMVERGWGRFINLGSIMSVVALAG